MNEVNEILESAKQELLQGGIISPTFFVIGSDEILVLDDDDFGGDELIDELKLAIKENKSDLVLYVTETYFKAEGSSLEISDFIKNGKTGLMLTTITPYREFTRIIPFYRSKIKESISVTFDDMEINIDGEELTGYSDVIFEHTYH